MRNLIILLLFSSVINVAFSQEKKPIENDSIISWNASKKLEWKDFNGKLNPNIFAYAVTSYKIEIIPQNVIVDANDQMPGYKDLDVLANFYKKQSWTISDDIELLNHEQLHFDIAELFARKIRKRFLELKTSKEKNFNKYQHAYNILWKECRLLQKQYDIETNHGANKTENTSWENKVNTQLLNLKDFE